MEEARFDDGGRPVAKPLPPARNQKIFQYPSNIDTISFPRERGGSFFLLFFFQRQREQSLGPTLYYIKRAATFVKISSSSSSVVPLNRASKSSNENYPNHRIRSPKAATKKKRAHKRCPLLDSPRGQTRQTKRGRGGLSAFMAETCSRRRIALDSTRIARINPFLRTTIEIGNMERGEGTVPHPHA